MPFFTNNEVNKAIQKSKKLVTEEKFTEAITVLESVLKSSDINKSDADNLRLRKEIQEMYFLRAGNYYTSHNFIACLNDLELLKNLSTQEVRFKEKEVKEALNELYVKVAKQYMDSFDYSNAKKFYKKSNEYLDCISKDTSNEDYMTQKLETDMQIANIFFELTKSNYYSGNFNNSKSLKYFSQLQTKVFDIEEEFGKIIEPIDKDALELDFENLAEQLQYGYFYKGLVHYNLAKLMDKSDSKEKPERQIAEYFYCIHALDKAISQTEEEKLHLTKGLAKEGIYNIIKDMDDKEIADLKGKVRTQEDKKMQDVCKKVNFDAKEKLENQNKEDRQFEEITKKVYNEMFDSTETGEALIDRMFNKKELIEDIKHDYGEAKEAELNSRFEYNVARKDIDKVKDFLEKRLDKSDITKSKLDDIKYDPLFYHGELKKELYYKILENGDSERYIYNKIFKDTTKYKSLLQAWDEKKFIEALNTEILCDKDLSKHIKDSKSLIEKNEEIKSIYSKKNRSVVDIQKINRFLLEETYQNEIKKTQTRFDSVKEILSTASENLEKTAKENEKYEWTDVELVYVNYRLGKIKLLEALENKGIWDFDKNDKIKEFYEKLREGGDDACTYIYGKIINDPKYEELKHKWNEDKFLKAINDKILTDEKLCEHLPKAKMDFWGEKFKNIFKPKEIVEKNRLLLEIFLKKNNIEIEQSSESTKLRKQIEKYEEALKLFKSAGRLGNLNRDLVNCIGVTHYQLGLLRAMSNDRIGAQKEFDIAIEKIPTKGKYYRARASTKRLFYGISDRISGLMNVDTTNDSKGSFLSDLKHLGNLNSL